MQPEIKKRLGYSSELNKALTYFCARRKGTVGPTAKSPVPGDRNWHDEFKVP